MKYSRDTLHKLLLRLQSIDYPGYKDATELDVLSNLLTQEAIVDYTEIEWSAFYQRFIDEGVEILTSHIIPREETIRVLTFLRDNAQKSVFPKAVDEALVQQFEKECARLIHQNLVESQRDQVHGDAALWPRPNLQRIAQGVSFRPKMSEDDKIIIKHLPSYPHYIGAFPPDMIVFVAHEFTDTFLNKSAIFQGTQDKSTMPNMSQAAYIDPIRYRLMQLADRYMYFDKEPAYQVLWVMGVLLRACTKNYWCNQKFSDGISQYLNLTQSFRNTKPQMDAAVAEIMHRTQPQLEFDIPSLQPEPQPKQPTRITNKILVEQLANLLNEQPKNGIDAPRHPFVLAQFIHAENVQIESNHAPITSIEKSDVTINQQ